jgi:glycine/D-amino acid oxidase-like deaminating enzyme
MAGIEVPIENSARTIVVTDAVEEIAPDRPFVEDLTAEWYFRPEVDGVLMGMGKKPVPDPNRVPLDEAQLEAMIELAMHRVPALSRSSLLTAWTGVRPLTSDGFPIVGEAPGVEGFLLNCGWGGVGIMLAPIAGMMLSEMVCGGKIEIIDPGPLHLSRFGRSDPQGEKQDV